MQKIAVRPTLLWPAAFAAALVFFAALDCPVVGRGADLGLVKDAEQLDVAARSPVAAGR